MKLKGMVCGICAALLWLPVSGQAAIAPATRPSSATVPATQGNLTVRITGIRSNNGVIRIAIFNNQMAYENKDANAAGSYKRALLPIKNNMAVWQLNGLPYGDYAIKLYHDEDNSGKLKKNLVGKPKEGVGFSNNPKLNSHAPSYAEVKFPVSKLQTTLNIQMINP